MTEDRTAFMLLVLDLLALLPFLWLLFWTLRGALSFRPRTVVTLKIPFLHCLGFLVAAVWLVLRYLELVA